MVYYDGTSILMGIHSIKVTMQNGSQSGSFIFKVYGNCHGKEILSGFDFNELSSDIILSDTVEIRRLPEKKLFSIRFLPSEQVEEVSAKTLEDMVVKLEIVNFEEMNKAPIYIPSLFKEKPKPDFRPDASETRRYETLRSKIKKTIHELI